MILLVFVLIIILHKNNLIKNILFQINWKIVFKVISLIIY